MSTACGRWPWLPALCCRDYYPRFGFIPASAFGIRTSFEVPDEALMALTLNPSAETPRGTIAYPAPFGV